MTELFYLPADWQDEVIPDPQTDPDRFIFRDPTGTFYLRPAEDQDDHETYTKSLKDGDVIMFAEHIDFGSFTLTVHDDAVSWSTDVPIPEAVNFLRKDRDSDTLQQTIPLLISENGLEAGLHDIDAYWWSDYEVAFKFVADGDHGRFVKIGRANQ